VEVRVRESGEPCRRDLRRPLRMYHGSKKRACAAAGLHLESGGGLPPPPPKFVEVPGTTATWVAPAGMPAARALGCGGCTSCGCVCAVCVRAEPVRAGSADFFLGGGRFLADS
jgi:hypothetical protein